MWFSPSKCYHVNMRQVESVCVCSGLNQASEFLFVFSGRDPNMNPVVRVTWWTQECESEYESVCNGEIEGVNAVFGFMISFKTNGNVLPVVRMLLVYLCVCVSVNAEKLSLWFHSVFVWIRTWFLDVQVLPCEHERVHALYESPHFLVKIMFLGETSFKHDFEVWT